MINQNKKKLKENLIRKFDIDANSLIASSPKTSEAEIDEVVKQITSVDDKFSLRPYDSQLIPLGKNSDRVNNLFHRRKFYRDYALPESPKSLDELNGTTTDDTTNFQGESRKSVYPYNVIDFLYEKTFYGKIDTKNRSIYPSEKFLKLLNSDEDKSIFLLNFVADAANEMRTKIKRLVEVGKISKNSIYANFEFKKGWVNFKKTHHSIMNSVYSRFIQDFALLPTYYTKIIDFKSYVNSMMDMLNTFLLTFPITRTNLQLTNRISPNISGIVFDISEDNHDDDKNKYLNYILDPNFEDIANIANGYGFLIDKNAPWRFIADLESPQMKDRMSNLGFNTLQDMFDAYYYNTHVYEVNSIRDYFLSFYDSYVEAYPNYSTIQSCGTGSKTKSHVRAKRTKNPFTDHKLLEFYFFIRAKEVNKRWNQEDFDKHVREAIQVFDNYGFEQALHYINDKTTQINGFGANSKMTTKNIDNVRIFESSQSYSNRRTFTIKL